MMVILAVLIWGVESPSMAQGTEPFHVPFEKVVNNSLIYEDPDIKSYLSFWYDTFNDITFVGARDYVISLDRALQLVQKKNLPVLDSTLCISEGHPEADCHNFIKVLFESQKGNATALYACGTYAFDPLCNGMKPRDISRVRTFYGVDKSPRNPHVPGTCSSWFSSKRELLFLATAFDVNGANGEIVIIKMDSNAHAKRLRKTKLSDDHPVYAGVFQQDSYVYFVMSERAIESKATYVSRIGRVCDDGDPDQDGIVSYNKITLQCGEYNMVQGIYYLYSEFKLFATFRIKDFPGKSAICYYGIVEILEAFSTNPYLCQDDGKWEPCSVRDRDPGPNPVKTCNGTRNVLDVDDRILLNGTINPICGGPVFKGDADLGLIVVKREDQPSTAGYKAYVSDGQGKIWNLRIGYCYEPVELYETWQVVPDNSNGSSKVINALGITYGQVHILTDERVIRVETFANIIPTTPSTIQTAPTPVLTTYHYFPSDLPSPYTIPLVIFTIPNTERTSEAAKVMSTSMLTVTPVALVMVTAQYSLP